MLEEAGRSAGHPAIRAAAEEGIRSEIAKVQERLAEITQSRVEPTSDLVVRVVPETDRPHDFHSSHLIVPQLDAIRRGIQALSGYLLHGFVPRRPTQEMIEMCDVGVDWVGSGSVRIGLTLPRPDEDNVQGARVARASQLVLDALAWVGSEGADDTFAQVVPDSALRTVVLAEIARMAPPTRGTIRTIEFSGVRMDGAASLDRTSGAWIEAAIVRLGTPPAEELAGVVRAVDLDRQMVVLRTEERRRVRCEFAFDDLVYAELGRRLSVVGHRPLHRGRPSSVLLVTSVHPLRDEESDEE